MAEKKKRSLNLKTPDQVIKMAIEYAFPREYKKDTIAISVASIVTLFVCYFYEMIMGYSGPDSIIEGVYRYNGSYTALSMGRWLVAYGNERLFRDVVIPPLVVAGYVFLITISIFIVTRMSNIRKPGFLVLLTSLMISFHVVMRQFQFMYMAIYYAVAFLCVIAGIYFIRKRKVWSVIAGIMLFVVMLGAYQAYIGAVAGIAVVLLMIDLSDGRKLSGSFIDLGLIAGSGVAACILDMPIMNYLMAKNGVASSSRVNGFSISDIIENFGFSFEYSYKWFFAYFLDDEVLSRGKLFLILFVIIGALVAVNAISLIKQRKIANAVILIICAVVLPWAMNLCQFIFPHTRMTKIMMYQYVGLFILLFALLERVKNLNIASISEWVAYINVCLLLLTYIISDNASALCLKLAYEGTYTQAIEILGDVYDLDGYKPSETTILFGGLINYTDTQEYFRAHFRLADLEPGPVFWGGDDGARTSRFYYMLDYLGVNAGWIEPNEYYAIIDTEEFKNMPVWPANGSVKMINDVAVVKLDGDL